MSTNLAVRDQAQQIERVMVGGDLSQLKPEERVAYYKMTCESLGLNPLTKPFEYITLNGKLQLYARKDCTDQLRNVHGVSVAIAAREVVEDCYVVTAKAMLPSGRTDESIGAVSIGNLKGDAKCNALMKAETKAKRRVTLSICGLGILDESEIETIPGARTGEPQAPPQSVSQHISFKKPTESAPNGNGKAVLQEGKPEEIQSPTVSSGAETDSAAGAAVGETQGSAVVSHAPNDPPAVEYIDGPKQRNFHRECRKAVRQERQMDADNLTYQWLADHGYKDKDGLPTASKIPAAGWLQVRERAVEWLRKQ